MKINCYLQFYQYLKSRWFPGQDSSLNLTTHQDLKNFKSAKQVCSTTDFRIHGRALHYSFKVGDRKRSIRFYREILGMKILRHEEFTQGSEIDSRNSYNYKWSKTMVGYGAEDNYFAFELTYNYPVHNYLKGNEFISITIRSREAIARAKSRHWPILDGNILEAPGGFRFHILDEPQPTKEDPVVKITLACSDLKKSLYFWHGVLGMILYERDNRKRSILVGFKSNEAKLELQQIDQSVNLGEQSGRIYFSCPYYQQPEIAEKVKNRNFKVVVPLIALETPGKPTVRLLVLCDPDGHEVCFVEDLVFRQLSQYSPEDEEDLNRHLAMENERDNLIGEPAKRAETKQIEESVKKALLTSNKPEVKKNVSITLPVREMVTSESIVSEKSERSMIQSDAGTIHSIETRKMMVIVTRSIPKDKSSSKLKQAEMKKPSSSDSDSSEETNSESEPHEQLVRVAKPRKPEDLEAAVKKVVASKLEETIKTTMSQNLEATVTRVVSERINETVQKVVSDKIEQTVARAVAHMENSMKMAVSSSLSVIEEEPLSNFPILKGVQDETRPKRSTHGSKQFLKRPSKADRTSEEPP